MLLMQRESQAVGQIVCDTVNASSYLSRELASDSPAQNLLRGGFPAVFLTVTFESAQSLLLPSRTQCHTAYALDGPTNVTVLGPTGPSPCCLLPRVTEPCTWLWALASCHATSCC